MHLIKKFLLLSIGTLSWRIFASACAVLPGAVKVPAETNNEHERGMTSCLKTQHKMS